jgi:imidazole glycerol-phosphate synthase subunit HisH
MITVIDYGVGNIGSVSNTLKAIGLPFDITADTSRVEDASALLLPGVGAAGVGMNNLQTLGLDRAIQNAVLRGVPLLGICLGMQLLFEKSEEGDVSCLGILKGTVNKFTIERRVPQIGWNAVVPFSSNRAAKKLFKGIPPASPFYFVNSFYCRPENPEIIAATTEYGETFASVIATDTIVATQFHPEKSGKLGFQLLKNFMKGYL